MLYGNVRTRCEKAQFEVCQSGRQWSPACAQGRTKTTTTQLSPSTDGRNLPRAPAMKTEWQVSFLGNHKKGPYCQQCLDGIPPRFRRVASTRSRSECCCAGVSAFPFLFFLPAPADVAVSSTAVATMEQRARRRGSWDPGDLRWCGQLRRCVKKRWSCVHECHSHRNIDKSSINPWWRATPLMEESLLVYSG